MTWLLWAAVIYCVVSPPRYDPAIRWKEYQRTGSWEWPYD